MSDNYVQQQPYNWSAIAKVTDRTIGHQIQFMRTKWSGGLGIAVTCNCLINGSKMTPLVDRNIESLDDAWEVWKTHARPR